MTRLTYPVWISMVAAACSSKAAPSGEPGPTRGSAAAGSATATAAPLASLVERAAAEAISRPSGTGSPCDRLPEALARAAAGAARSGAIAASCLHDTWTPAALDCYLAAGSATALDACRVHLTPPQRDFLNYRLGRAERRPLGWSCTDLGRYVAAATPCHSETEADRLALEETQRSVDDALPVFATPALDLAELKTTELRCITIQVQLVDMFGAKPCAAAPAAASGSAAP